MRGFCKLTYYGIDYAVQHTFPLSPADVEHLAIGYMDVKLRQLNDAVPVDPESLLSSTLPSATISPDDRLEQALAELREAAAGELLENLLQVSPGRFEVIVDRKSVV